MMAAPIDSREIFNNLSHKFSQLLYTRTEGDRNLINKTLNELNALNFRQPVITNTSRALLLIHNCCTFISPEDTVLVGKSCQLITNLIDKQHVQIEGRTLSIAVEWTLQALKQKDSTVSAEVLHLLDAILRSNTSNLDTLIPCLIHPNSILLKLAENSDLQLTSLALRCLEACTFIQEEDKKRKDEPLPHLKICVRIFMRYLTSPRQDNFDNLHYYKILISCVRGLENIITQDTSYLKDNLEYILGIIKCFMVYQLNGMATSVPERVRPSTMSIPDPSMNTPREKKGGKIAKQRKTRLSNSSKRGKNLAEARNEDVQENGYVPASTVFDSNSDSDAQLSGFYSGTRTSDSDFSDSGRQSSIKVSIIAGTIRQASLHLFLSIIKLLDKKTLFSYWSSFLPDGSPYAFNSLATCIWKDSSPKGRMAALNVLLAMITNAKLYLSLAEYSEKTTSFTPFTMVIGSMIRELHRILILALNENSLPVLLQVLKCLAALVQASPYNKLGPGLIPKIVRNVKGYISHRDSSIQVAALIVLGCVLASEPIIPETKEIFLRQMQKRYYQSVDDFSKNTDVKTEQKENVFNSEEDIEYACFSSEDEDQEDLTVTESKAEMSWLVARCLNNLGVSTNGKEVGYTAPTPVKLESLQIISVMSRNYFDCYMVSHISYIMKALDAGMSDKYTEVKLHAGKALDFIGQAINNHFNTYGLETKLLPVNTGVSFWQTLLNGPLSNLLQNEDLPALKTVGSDCIGSIGPHVFDRLSRDKQLFMISVLFSYAQEEDKNVRAAAVRALAICVMHPSQREDIGFVIDTAEAILNAFTDTCIAVRIKSSWSLGNLSDALVLIREHSISRADPHFVEEIPDALILRLIEESIKGCKDNDKIRTNTVRALGNLFQLITPKLITIEKFRKAVESGIKALIENCTTRTNMKVRWNACYAIGNVLKNQVLYEAASSWQDAVFNTLTDVVVNFRNFKVRINAALALSSPVTRKLYGNYYYTVWSSLMKALENSYHMQDFSEYKHRDHLIDQICLTIGHLVTLLTTDDLSNMKEHIGLSIQILNTHMNLVLERLVPEKATILVNATTHISTLLKSQNLSSDDRALLQELKEIFGQNSTPSLLNI